jgi:hypothetical protein
MRVDDEGGSNLLKHPVDSLAGLFLLVYWRDLIHYLAELSVYIKYLANGTS